MLAIGAGIVVAGAVTISIWLDPPGENRARSLDRDRIWRLTWTENAINSHYRLHKKLPANLEELESGSQYLRRVQYQDPGTGKPFEYEVVGERDYRLCAVFERSSEDEPLLNYGRKHTAGRNCFDQKLIPSNE
jgi:hypothetical protein